MVLVHSCLIDPTTAFMDWFRDSEFANHTIIVLTAGPCRNSLVASLAIDQQVSF